MATIIVVEDDLDINDIETIALKNIGYDVISCTCAGEFWEVMKQRTPELVLLDIMLEDEDGLAILKKSSIKSADSTAVLTTILPSHLESWSSSRALKPFCEEVREEFLPTSLRLESSGSILYSGGCMWT